jgi:ABC-type glycerol-3-phosphate transport system substrate-binding protein
VDLNLNIAGKLKGNIKMMFNPNDRLKLTAPIDFAILKPMLDEYIQPILEDKRKLVVAITVILVITLGFLVIIWPRNDNPDSSEAPSNSPASIKAELVWWNPNFGPEVYNDIIKDFRSEYKNVQIEVVKKDYEDEYYKSLIREIARDSGPDIFSIRNDDLPAYKEFMSPISFFSGERLTQYKTDYTDFVIRDTTDRDSVYGVTSYVDNLQLYYNKDILSREGIALPPKTWDDLEKQLKDLNERDPGDDLFQRSAISLGTGNQSPNSYNNTNVAYMEDILPMLIFQKNGQIYDYRNESSAIESNPNSNYYEALNFYLSFANPSSSNYSWNNESEDNITAFAQEELAYMIGYKKTEEMLLEQNPVLDYGVAEIPQFDQNNPKTYGYFFMDGINKNIENNSNKKIAAEAFLYYLSLPETQQKFAEETDLPGARKDILQEQRGQDEKLRVFSLGALYADNYYKPDVEASEKMWQDMFYKIHFETGKYSTGRDPSREDALGNILQEVSQQYQTILKKDPTLRS